MTECKRCLELINKIEECINSGKFYEAEDACKLLLAILQTFKESC